MGASSAAVAKKRFVAARGLRQCKDPDETEAANRAAGLRLRVGWAPSLGGTQMDFLAAMPFLG